MSKKIIFPDLLKYPTVAAYRTAFPELRFNNSSYFRARKEQKKLAKAVEAEEERRHRSIVRGAIEAAVKEDNLTEENQLKKMVELATSQNIPIKSIMPAEDAIRISQRAIRSVKLAMVGQWQAAAWWLERVHPEIFAKREASTQSASIIGIRLEVHHRQAPALSKRDDVTRLSLPDVKNIKEKKTSRPWL